MGCGCTAQCCEALQGTGMLALVFPINKFIWYSHWIIITIIYTHFWGIIIT